MEETDFVGYGSCVAQIGDDESLSRFSNENKLKAQKVRDKQGRERFHGAFTGGFSAGYYNTVGTEEGWTPSTFSSSHQKDSKNRRDDKRGSSSGQRKPEDYMDEEDLEQFGIAPRQIQTSETYKQSNQRSERAAWDPVVPGITDALTEAIKPVHMSIAAKLLRLMGWKPGQGIGPRVKRKTKQQRVVGPALPQEVDGESSDDDYMSHVTFAPKDMNPISFDVKDDLHGMGYQPLSIKSQSRSSAVEEERLTFGGHSRGITGKAFGVGIEEDDDDADIYGKEKMSDYDMTLGNEPEDLHTFTKPTDKSSKSRPPPIYQSSATLEGFCLAQKNDRLSEKYTVPEIPQGYRPKAAITGVSELPKIYGKMDKTLRGLIIGETGKDAGLLPAVDDTKASEPLLPGKSAELNLNDTNPPVNQQYTEDDAPLPPLRSMEPLNKQSIDFKPFAKNPEKQARYERYLLLRRSGDRDAYGKVAPQDFRRNDREREREEFERSGKFFKDLSGIMASRFTRSKETDEDDDSKVSVRVDEEMDDLLDDKKQAVKMKMFGKLTRESYEWHPHRLMCRRFNIPDPYPDSQLVGLPTVYKDKISAYNFLDIETLTKTPAELKEREERDFTSNKESEAAKQSKLINSSTGPKSLPAGEKAPVDLFKAVFQDSGSEDEKSSSEEETSEEEDDAASSKRIDKSLTTTPTKSTFQSLQEQYSQGRSVASIYDTAKISDPPQTDGSLGGNPDSGRSLGGNPDHTTFRVKFVPKKDRYKVESKEKKTRWSSHEDTNTTQSSNVSDVTTQSSDDLPSQVQDINPTIEPSALDPGNDTTSNTVGTVLPIENVPVPITAPGTPPTPEIRTPPSANSDEDSWMPALPPALTDTAASECTADKDVSHKHRHKKSSKHKDRQKEKHKKSKSKKSHKEHKKR